MLKKMNGVVDDDTKQSSSSSSSQLSLTGGRNENKNFFKKTKQSEKNIYPKRRLTK